MSDFPFKVGDLVDVKTSSWTKAPLKGSGVIVQMSEDAHWVHVLIGETVQKIHRTLLVTPRIKSVKINGGRK